MCFIVYKTTNQVNGKYYVGQHNTSAEDGYIGSGVLLQRAVDKYGQKNFIRETIEYCTSANVDKREIYWIDALSAKDPNIGYNITDGGTGGFTTDWTPTERDEISVRMKEWWANASEDDKKNHSLKVSMAHKGYVMPEEYKDQRRKTCTAWWDSNPEEKLKRKYKYSGKGNPNSKYYYRILRNDIVVEETYNLREFCEKNKFPLSYFKHCVRTTGRYKDFVIIRQLK